MSIAALPERFWAKVDKTDSCWLWTASTTRGYGRLHGRRAHRLAYEALVGPVPDGLELDHLCNTTRCVNPAHLEPVTHEENVRRAVARRSACSKGHPRTEENLIPRSDRPGKFRCLPCRKSQGAAA